MKKVFLILAVVFGCATAIQAQSNKFAEPFLTDEERPDGKIFVPNPPEVLSSEFYNDFFYYEWGKDQRDNAYALSWAIEDETVALNIAFSEVLGFTMDEEHTPEIYKLLSRATSDAHAANTKVKDYYQRTRPFATFRDATPRPEVDEEEAATFSYPSGHSSRGWMYALTLCTVAPELSNLLNLRAQHYALNRVIMGRHWKSDIDNSLLLTATVFAVMVQKQEFQEQLAKAKAEYAEKKAQATNPVNTAAVDRKAIKAFYDISGRPMPTIPTEPGLYIRDGKKVIVK